MKYKNIPDLYLIKGKIVFRKHITVNGKSFNIWKTLGNPEDFSENELIKIVTKLRKKVYEKILKFRDVKKVEKNSVEGVVKAILQEEAGKTVKHKLKFESEPIFTKEPTFGEILEKFFSWYKAVRKKSTYKAELKRSRNLIRFFGKNFPFLRIGTKEIEEYRIYRINQGTSKSTINKDLRLLSTVINRAVEFEWIPEHKLYRKPLLFREVKNERVRYLSKEEEERLLQVLDSGKNKILKNVVLLSLHTGMRLGEVLNLKWENVDFKNKVLVLFPDQTKNKKRHVIPLNKIAYKALKEQETMKLLKCPYVFHRNGRKIKSIKDGFKNALKKAGIEDFRFHDLRHTF
ncbi:MAG: hypothetical protein C0169_05570, partial [Thermodesulfobacterium geofontis]